MEEADFDKQLDAMQQDWDEKVRTGPNDVTEGDHVAMCDKFEVGASESGKLMITRRHVVLSGEKKGKNIRDYIVLTNQYGPYFLAQWAKTLGVSVPKINSGSKGMSKEDRIKSVAQSLEPMRKAAMNTEVIITVKKQKDSDFSNVYVNPK